MEAHNEIVAGVAERVKHFHALQKPFRIYHGSTNSTRASPKSASNTVDTSRLANVLAVDPARRTATAEPNVPLGDLVAATLAHGLVPLVVMEFPGITVGGGFSGSSGESSSFRHGAFDATVESIEIVLADGAVERASRADKPEAREDRPNMDIPNSERNRRPEKKDDNSADAYRPSNHAVTEVRQAPVEAGEQRADGLEQNPEQGDDYQRAVNAPKELGDLGRYS